MKTAWIFPIESLDTRYTKQWHTFLPLQIQEFLGSGFRVKQIDGEQVPPRPTPGAFLDFAATNIWKSTQLAEFMRLVQNQEVQKGDYVLVTDAWNPCILQLRYTSDLLGLDLKIGGILHAGSYDPNDFLGRACGGKSWTQKTEEAIFYASDHVFFATQEHIELFGKTYPDLIEDERVVRTGFPFEYFSEIFEPYRGLEKRNLILFPHRIAPEKKLETFKKLAERLPEYEWVVCQEQELSKDDYHRLLGESKIVFSANLQETLGISCMEALLADSFPLMPDRLTYPEMYAEEFLYPSEWADENSDDIEKLAERVQEIMTQWDENQNDKLKSIATARKNIEETFLTAEIMYCKIKECLT